MAQRNQTFCKFIMKENVKYCMDMGFQTLYYITTKHVGGLALQKFHSQAVRGVRL